MGGKSAFALASVLLGAGLLAACDNSVSLGVQADSGLPPSDLGEDSSNAIDAGIDSGIDAPPDAGPDAALRWEDFQLAALSGMNIDYAIDSEDQEHFVVGNSESLHYGIRVDGSLRSTVIDPDVFINEQPSLALDSMNQPRVAYVDYDAHELRYASWRGSSWQTEHIELSAPVFGAASLAFNSFDEATIAFECGEPMIGVFLATRTPEGEWNTTRLTHAGTFAHAPQVFYDSMDRLHIVGLMSARELAYAVRDVPSVDPVFSVILTSSSLIYFDATIDEADVVHVAASEDDGHATTLRYGEHDGIGWAFSDVVVLEESISSGFSIATHPTAGVGIAYGNFPGDDMHYASRSGVTWMSTPVSVERGTGLYERRVAFDAAGDPHIAYQRDTVHVVVRH